MLKYLAKSALLASGLINLSIAAAVGRESLPICGGASTDIESIVKEQSLRNVSAPLTINLKPPEGAATEGSALSRETVTLVISNFKSSIEAARTAPLGDSLRNASGSEGLKITFEYSGIPAVQANADKQGLEILSQVRDKIKCLELPKPAYKQLWRSVPQIDAVSLGPNRGAGRIVAILDTGIDSAHPFLASRILSARAACYRTDGKCPNGNSEQVGSGAAESSELHGTHVAGIAAGAQGNNGQRSFSGVAPGAQIIPINIFSGESSWSTDQEKALEYILRLRRDEKLPIAAVNMSLGGGAFRYACDESETARTGLFRQLIALGVAPVVAAGNDGFPNQVSAPGCISVAITVSSVDTGDKVWTGHNRSEQLTDVLAPGRQILSSAPDDNYGPSEPSDDYEAIGGTSMAAPHVAGAFAVISERVPNASVDDILRALRESGVSKTDPETQVAYRRIDVDSAVERLLSPPPLIAGVESKAARVASEERSETASETTSGSAVIDKSGRQIAKFVKIADKAAGGSSKSDCVLDVGRNEGRNQFVTVPCSSLARSTDGRLVSILSESTLDEISRVQN